MKNAWLDKKNDEFMLTDFAKMERPKLLHIAFKALNQYRETKRSSPSHGFWTKCTRQVGRLKLFFGGNWCNRVRNDEELGFNGSGMWKQGLDSRH